MSPRALAARGLTALAVALLGGAERLSGRTLDDVDDTLWQLDDGVPGPRFWAFVDADGDQVVVDTVRDVEYCTRGALTPYRLAAFAENLARFPDRYAPCAIGTFERGDASDPTPITPWKAHA